MHLRSKCPLIRSVSNGSFRDISLESRLSATAPIAAIARLPTRVIFDGLVGDDTLWVTDRDVLAEGKYPYNRLTN